MLKHNVPRETSKNDCIFNKICYYITGAININGTRSGSEDSSLNVLYLCAPFLLGDFMDDIYYMKEALKEAALAFKKNEIPVGVVIVKDGKIVARAHNMKEKKANATKHAEIIAISKASRKLKNWRLIDCIMYVTMIPCPMCASAINQSRMKKIIYGTMPEYANKKLIKEILCDKKYKYALSTYKLVNI